MKPGRLGRPTALGAATTRRGGGLPGPAGSPGRESAGVPCRAVDAERGVHTGCSVCGKCRCRAWCTPLLFCCNVILPANITSNQAFLPDSDVHTFSQYQASQAWISNASVPTLQERGEGGGAASGGKGRTPLLHANSPVKHRGYSAWSCMVMVHGHGAWS